MAEAGGESTGPPPPPVHYFCYSCNREITGISQNFTCSTCGSGFIEEIQASADHLASPPPLLFGSGGSGGGLGNFFRSLSQPAGQGQQQGQAISFDLFDILSSGLQGQGQANSASAPTSGSGPPTPNSSRPRGHISFVIDSRPRHGASRSDGGGTALVVGGSGMGNAGAAPSGPGGHPGPANPMENMLASFLNDLITGLGGQEGGHVNITGVPVLGNLGDYVWGRDGLDAIVTQLMNQMEGTGPPPMPEDKVKEIPDVSISQEQVDRKLQCSVCWDDFKLDEKVKQLECEHLFHPDCILPWLKLHGTCPICRRDFTDGINPQQDSTQANPDNTANPNSTATGTGTGTGPNTNASNPQGASSTTSNPSPLAFLASLVNPGSPFSLIGNPTTQHSGQGQDSSRNPNGADPSRDNGGSGGGGRGTGGGGHLDLDNMEFDFD